MFAIVHSEVWKTLKIYNTYDYVVRNLLLFWSWIPKFLRYITSILFSEVFPILQTLKPKVSTILDCKARKGVISKSTGFEWLVARHWPTEAALPSVSLERRSRANAHTQILGTWQRRQRPRRHGHLTFRGNAMLPSARIRYATNAGRAHWLPCTHFDSLDEPRWNDKSEDRWNKQTDEHRERILVSLLKRNGGKSLLVVRRCTTMGRHDSWSTYGDRNNRETQAIYVYITWPVKMSAWCTGTFRVSTSATIFDMDYDDRNASMCQRTITW